MTVDGYNEYAVVSDAFSALTRVTPDCTAYVRFCTPPDSVHIISVGAANYAIKVCVDDDALSRPLALPNATTTMLTFSVSTTEMDAV